MNDDEDAVRLAAATALANTGHRDALPVFVNLLESEDVSIRSRSGSALRSLSIWRAREGAPARGIKTLPGSRVEDMRA